MRRRSLRVVIDTNIFVSALLQGPLPRRVYHAFLEGFLTPVFTEETLTELLDVLSRPALRVLMSDAEVKALVALIQRDGLFVTPAHAVRACRDPKDDALLSCALTGHADYLITGDHDLLVLDPFHHIRILRPSDFLRVLDRRANS